jgi:hypothetical protein
MAVRLSCPATFRRAGPLCLSLPLGCSQSHAVLGCLLIRRPHTPLKFTSDHTGLYLLTRERLQSSDVFLRPRTQSRSLRHLFSLSSCRPSVAVSKTKTAPNLRRSHSIVLYHEQYAYHVAMWITVASLKRPLIAKQPDWMDEVHAAMRKRRIAGSRGPYFTASPRSAQSGHAWASGSLQTSPR